MPAKVWVTGAAGFTGQHLLAELTVAGYQVITDEADLTEPAALQACVATHKPDYIIHLAAVSFVPDGNNTGVYAVNTLGTDNLLAAASKHPPRKILLASSAQVYGAQPDSPITEEAFPRPVNHYGCSKLAMEYIASTYSDQLAIQVIRPFNYTGCGQAEHFLIPKLVKHFADKKPSIRLGNLDIWRDISDVRRITQIYQQLLETPPQPEVLNACSGELVKIGEVIDTLAELTSHMPDIEQDPALIRVNEPPCQLGSSEKLTQTLPDLPPARPFRETLAWMIAHHNANHHR